MSRDFQGVYEFLRLLGLRVHGQCREVDSQRYAEAVLGRNVKFAFHT